MSQQNTTTPALQDIQWLSSGRRGRQGHLANIYASISVSKVKNKRHNTAKLNVTLYSSLVKKMKLIKGDRLAVGLAPGGVVLKRDNEYGFSLYPTGKQDPSSKMPLDSRLCVTVHNFASTPREYLQKSEVVFLGDGAVFLPFSEALSAA